MRLPTIHAEADVAKMVDIVFQWTSVVEARMRQEASREWLESTLRDFLRRGLIETLKVIEAADAGDGIADAALRRVFVEMLDRGEMPPAALRAYGEKAALVPPVSMRSAGRNAWYDNWRRDIGICVLMYMTVNRFGLSPNRNRKFRRSDHHPSAASVVAAALGRLRPPMNVDEKRVGDIWGDLKGEITRYVFENRTVYDFVHKSPLILQN
jgi:hypothetical protein